MGLENLWQIFSWAVMFVTAPLWATSLIDNAPFSKKSGWAWLYSQELKDPNNPRRSPFGVPLIVSTVLWIIVAIGAAIPSYVVYHNGGLNDGWVANPIPLFFGVVALGLTNWWLPVYLINCRCYNILWAQIFAIGASLAFFCYMLSDAIPKYYSILSVGLLAWNVFWALKNFFEENKRCGLAIGVISTCPTEYI